MTTVSTPKRRAIATRPLWGLFTVACAFIPILIGCGGVYDATASGVVTIDQKPVPRGTVAYHSVSGGPAAYGRINEDGTYDIYAGREEGLPAGEYQVTVSATEASPTLQNEKGGPPPPGKQITPPWYRTKETSGLKFTVAPGKNTINLELTTQPPPGWKPPRAPMR